MEGGAAGKPAGQSHAVFQAPFCDWDGAVEEPERRTGTMVENAIHESAAKRILHKLNPAHHKETKDNGKGKANDDTAEVHQSPEVTDDVKPLVERTKHVHSHASHPTVESCAPSLTPGCPISHSHC